MSGSSSREYPAELRERAPRCAMRGQPTNLSWMGNDSGTPVARPAISNHRPSNPFRPAFLDRGRGESADRVDQLVDIVGRGGKGGDETDDTGFPTAVVKAVTLVQKSVDDLLGQAAEEDVRLCARKASAGNGLQPPFEPRGHGIGVPGIAQPQIVGEVGVELGSGETHLGSELSGSLSPEAELGGHGAVEDDDRIGGYAPVLGGAKGQDVHASAPR